MKVIQETHSQMTLRLRPWFLWFFGAIFSTGGLSVAIVGSQVNTFSCNRDNIAPATCQISSKGLFWSKQQVLTLKDIQGAGIRTVKDSKGNSSYHLLILTNEGEVSPLPINFANQTTVTNWVQDIELFLKETQQQNLLIEDDNRLFIVLFGSLFVSTGLAIAVLMGKVVVCDIDKTLGKLTLAKYGIIGNSQTEYSTRDIRAITLQKSVSSKGGSTYRLALVMHSGEYIPFTSYYSSGFRQQQRTADIISQFLNVPSLPDNDNLMSFKDAFSTFKNVAGLGLMNQQKREDQLAHLQQEVMNNRHDAEANYQYGFALYVLQRHQEAQPFLAEAKRLFDLSGNKLRVIQIDAFLDSLNRKL